MLPANFATTLPSVTWVSAMVYRRPILSKVRMRKMQTGESATVP